MLNILVVDDEEAILYMLTEVLKKYGFNVETALGGIEGVQKFDEGVFDLVITDLCMPGIDGNEVIHLSRTLSPATKFLIHTGSSDYQLPHDLIQSGIDPQFVFRKPLLDMSILLHAVTRLLQ